MKFRMDFVTNSSSSSFVAVLDANLENGEHILASYVKGEGDYGCDGEIINVPSDVELQRVETLDSIRKGFVYVDGKKLRMTSGTMTLACDAFGEYSYNAEPTKMLEDYFGSKWEFIAKSIDRTASEEEIIAVLKQFAFFRKYSEESLRNLSQILRLEDYEPRTEIIETLEEDGSFGLEINNGDITSPFMSYYEDYDEDYDGDEEDGEDADFGEFPSVTRRRSIRFETGEGNNGTVTLGGRSYYGTAEELQVYIDAYNIEFSLLYRKMEEVVRAPIEQFFPSQDVAPEIRDRYIGNEEISFAGKNFWISSSSDIANDKFTDKIIEEIIKRGGVAQGSWRQSLDQDTDYVLESRGNLTNAWHLGGLLEVINQKTSRDKGKFITVYHLWKGFTDQGNQVLTDEQYDNYRCLLQLKELLQLDKEYKESIEKYIKLTSGLEVDDDNPVVFFNKYFGGKVFYNKYEKFLEKVGAQFAPGRKRKDYYVISSREMLKTQWNFQDMNEIVEQVEKSELCSFSKLDLFQTVLKKGDYPDIPSVCLDSAMTLVQSAKELVRRLHDDIEQVESVIGQKNGGLKIRCLSSAGLIEKMENAKKDIRGNFLKELKEWKKEIDVDHVESITVSGASFAFTGLLGWELIEKLYLDEHYGSLKFNRWNCGSRLKEYTEELGGEILDNVVKRCDYVIVGLNGGTTQIYEKAVRYRENGTSQLKIIAEDEFLRILAGERLTFTEEEMEGVRLREAKKKQEEEEKEAEIRRKAEVKEEQRRLQEEARQKRIEEILQVNRQRDEYYRQKELEKQEALAARQQEEARAAEERLRRIREEVIYRPGEEPVNIRRRMDTLFAKLDEAYPDKVISGLYLHHKKWGETVTELYRLLGYPDGNAMLEAYGYTVESNRGGRPVALDAEAVIAELRKRYPDGFEGTMEDFRIQNADLPIKTLMNNANELLGIPLGRYLKQQGIMKGGTAVSDEAEFERTPFIAELMKQVNLSRIEEKYIAIIEGLQARNGAVQAEDIVGILGTSRAAVSQVLQDLAAIGVVKADEAGNISLHLPEEKPMYTIPLDFLAGADKTALAERSEETEESSATDNLPPVHTPFVERIAQKIPLSGAEKRYLSVMDGLRNEAGIIRISDVAEVCGVSQPAVYRPIRNMVEKGILKYETVGVVSFVGSDDEADASADYGQLSVNQIAEIVSLTNAEKKYLTAIEEMQKKSLWITQTAIAERLGVSQAAVSLALSRMEEKGIIEKDADGVILFKVPDEQIKEALSRPVEPDELNKEPEPVKQEKEFSAPDVVSEEKEAVSAITQAPVQAAEQQIDRDELCMLAILFNEIAFGKKLRGTDAFCSIYSEDFPSLNSQEIIDLRWKVLSRINDEEYVARCTGQFKRLSIRERFDASTRNYFNVDEKEGDFGKRARKAIEFTRRWYEERELSEALQLLHDLLNQMRTQIDEQYKAVDPAWLSMDGARPSLHIFIEDIDPSERDEDCVFQREHSGAMVTVKLEKQDLIGISARVINCMPWYWNTTVLDIWNAALNNCVRDKRREPRNSEQIAYAAHREAVVQYCRELAAEEAASGDERRPAPSASRQAVSKPTPVVSPAVSAGKDDKETEKEEVRSKTIAAAPVSAAKPIENTAPAKTVSSTVQHEPAQEEARLTRRQIKIKQIEKELRALQKEYDQARGVFAFVKRVKLKGEIDELTAKLNRLKAKEEER